MNTEVKEYRCTKEDCQAGIDLNNLVCSHCGGKREPIETVDNSHNPTYWPGCMACQRFDYGVKPVVYEIAKKMVTDQHFVCYSHMDHPHGKDEQYQKYWLESQIGGTTSLVRDILNFHSQLTKNK